MATDNDIMEDELQNLCKQLKKNLHMKEVRKLARRHGELAKIQIQNERIKQLKKEFEELEPTVSMIYSSQSNLKDNQIKGYLLYLLQLKEHFTREVKSKIEIISKREDQIKCLVVRLCCMRNEYAKKLRRLPSKPSEFIRLESMTNRMNQINKKLCTLESESKELRGNILDMQMFQRQYKNFEKRIRSNVERLTTTVQKHLDNAVSIYEEREQFINKSQAYKERCLEDQRKAALNENMLNLVKEKTEKFEKFEKLQHEERMDSRIAATGDLIKKGVTGLEPVLRQKEDLYMDIARASTQITPGEMKNYFQLTEDKTASMFLYLEDTLERINHMENIVDELKAKNRHLLKNMTDSERRLRWEIKENQARVALDKVEAEKAEVYQNLARNELNYLFEYLWKIYDLCGLNDSEIYQIDDFNAVVVKEKVEKQIIYYLMLVEYLKMKEYSSIEEFKPIAEYADISVAELPKVNFIETIQPRVLKSENELSTLSTVEEAKTVLPLDRLKYSAKQVVAELETEDETNKDGSSDAN